MYMVCVSLIQLQFQCMVLVSNDLYGVEANYSVEGWSLFVIYFLFFLHEKTLNCLVIIKCVLR
jgi:hypothetical protein